MSFKLIEDCIGKITMAIDNCDLSIIDKEFDRLNEMFGKSLMIMTELPEYYVKLLIMLEDFFLYQEDNSDSFNYIRGKILIYCQQYEFFIQELRNNPKSSEDDEEREDAKTVCSDWDSDDQELYYKAEGPLWKREKNRLIRRFRNRTITWKTVYRNYIGVPRRNGKGCLIKMEQLAFLARVARTPAQKLKILRALVYSRFGALPGGNMPVNVWIKCLLDMFDIFDILYQYPNIIMDHKVTTDSDTRLGPEYGGEIQIGGNLSEIYVDLHTEFDRILISVKHNTEAYKDMLDCEPLLFVLSQYVHKYLVVRGHYKKATRVALKQMQLLYYKSKEAYTAMFTPSEEYSDSMYKVLVENQWLPPSFVEIVKPMPRQPIHLENLNVLMDNLIVFINKYGDQSTKTCAMMYDIYHRSILDRFTKSTKLPSMKNLWVEVQDARFNMVRVFNRAKAQLGLYTFRIGRIEKAHNLLSDICATEQTVEELLAQGVSQSSFHTLTPKQERLERRRQQPYHTHINLEILKAVHLICSILLEIPNMDKSLDPKGKFISNTFDRLLEMSETETLSGPIIRKEALNIYLLTCSSYDKSLSVNKLSILFGLSKKCVCNSMNNTGSQMLRHLVLDIPEAAASSS